MEVGRSLVRNAAAERLVAIAAACLLASAVFLWLFSPLASAQTTLLQLHTPLTGISVKPGETVDFDLEVQNNGSQPRTVRLDVSEAPDGWDATLTRQGYLVHEVRVQAQSSQAVTLNVSVPADAEAGDYRVRVQGRADNGATLALDLHVRVDEAATSATELEGEYRQLSGPSGASFQFGLTLNNRTAQEQIYALSAQPPRGWQVTFKLRGSNDQVASLSVDANSSQGINVEVRAPEHVPAGEYEIPVRAVSGTDQAEATLSIVITGQYEYEFNTPTGRLNADGVAGRDATMALEVTNTGSSSLQDITFSASLPANWQASFEPERIDNLEPGETATVTATITPSAQAISGDYGLVLTADSPDAGRRSLDVRFTVRTSTLWGWVGVLLVAVIVAAVYGLFRKYGRR